LEVKKGYSADEPDITVVEYHATLADRDKKRIYEEFKKPDSRIRILAATDALALGRDVPDIEIVVQYGLPGGWNINTVLQRFGRCARRTGLKALGVFFVESRLPLGLLLYV
jgi:superfamily II DNA/RNA helicase